MRKNLFGDIYCHNASEVDWAVDGAGYEPASDVYATNFIEAAGDDKATCDVAENVSGETVCHIEAASIEEVRAIVAAAKVPVIE